MYHFHVNLFARPRAAGFVVTWEDAAALLEPMSRMIFELDGSFVLSGNYDQGRRWQVDGHLFDFAGRLFRLELHGNCPPTTFDGLLRAVGWPAQQLEFEMVHAGVTVDEATFREQARIASSS